MVDRGDPASGPDADGPRARTDAPRKRRWFARRSPRDRTLLAIGALALTLAVIGIAWIVITGLLARSQLNDVKAELPKLRSALTSGDLPKARSLAAHIEDQARRAHELTSGPAWWVGANLPVLGEPMQTSRVVATEADAVGTQVLPGVVRLADQLDQSASLHAGRVDLAPIARLEPTLQSAARAAHSAAQHVSDTDGSWLPYVSNARRDVVHQLDQLDGELSGASRAVEVALPMLGQHGVQRYFVGFMNEAESRGLGGIPGSYAILTADHGKITFTHFGSDGDLHNVRANVSLGAEYNARYKQDDPTGVFQNSDISPDFRDAAQIWAGMWQKKTRQHIDGAIAIDPTALGYLLQVTGPVTLADGTVVNGDSVAQLTQQGQYRKFGSDTRADTAARKQYLVSLAKKIGDRLTQGGDAAQLVHAFSRAARERRLVVWSGDAANEARLQTADWAGAVVPDGRPFAGFVVNNASGGKIDYYLSRRMTYQRSGCNAGATAVATFTLHNGAPPSGLPAYVTIRADKAPKDARPGSESLVVTYYGTPGAMISRVTIDGRPITVAPLPEKGLVTATVHLELSAGSTHVVRVTTREPKTRGPVTILRQPLVQPVTVNARGPDC